MTPSRKFTNYMRREAHNWLDAVLARYEKGEEDAAIVIAWPTEPELQLSITLEPKRVNSDG